MRGTVLALPNVDQSGTISGDDGQRYQFSSDDLRGTVARSGQTVDFVAREGAACEVYPIVGQASASGAALGELLAQRDWVAFYFSPAGRVGRRDYWLLGVVVLALIGAFLGLVPGLNVVVFLVTAWSGLALMIKRCHDVDRSGWWSLVAFVPQLVLFVAIPASFFSHHFGSAPTLAVLASVALIIWFVVSVLARAGSQTPNRFGPCPQVIHM